ncbi:MAG TPA: shikimate dehydrogenase [Conexibacter sp.]|jgi:shikimate dehydrogenase|nr:shikimate dehydrogenase [Conexibacter sp.]
MPICGVLGWPVRHSRSPAMHEAGYAALGLDDWRYQLLPVPPELLGETVRALPAAGFAGANVTIPHKQAALALADQATPSARAIGAANTLTFQPGGRIHADNTDAPGLIDALPRDPAGTTAVVLGAGGSARAVVWALLDAGAADVLVWNRTRARAERLCAEIGGRVVDDPPQTADLLINTTSVGLQWGEDPFKALPLDADDLRGYPCLVDLAYGSAPTGLVSAARAAGVEVVDGLEILVRQGARSFERWTGRPAPLDVLRSAARGKSAAA